MAVNLVQLFINVLTKQFVSVNGSPITVPTQYDGDKPLFLICPVTPSSSNASNPQYLPVNLAGYTMNLVMAGTPDATNPPTPFASLDGMAWNASLNGLTGILDLTQAAVATFIGTAASVPAWITLDVTDPTLNRTTLIQQTFTLSASNDMPAVGPSGPGVQYLTLVMALNTFVQIGPVQGKIIIFVSPDGTKTKTLSCGNDGTMQWS